MGIRREFTYRYTPKQNGVAERKNWSIMEATQAMLEEKSMPKFYWAKAIRTAVYIQNQIGEKVLAHELYFSNIAYVHVPDEKHILVSYSHECTNATTPERNKFE